MRTVSSVLAVRRLEAASAFLADLAPSTEVLVVGASRGAVDDFARAVARSRGATFGLYRFSLTQLAARLAAPRLAVTHAVPATRLGLQAVAARTLFDADREGALSYFRPVAGAPGFPRALADTLEALSSNFVPAGALRRMPDGGSDLADLLERFDGQLAAASVVDRTAFLSAAAHAARLSDDRFGAGMLLLLDVPITSRAEHDLVVALVQRASDAFATSPAGDRKTNDALRLLGTFEDLDKEAGQTIGLDRLGRHLFAEAPPPAGSPLAPVELFSAPGEGRESVEIARRILMEARRGTPFDRVAIAVRSPVEYAGLLEHALRRAGVPVYFDRGTRRPHPAGRAFLALLACAADNLSARRFAEYLSLGQVPGVRRTGTIEATPASRDEVFGPLAERAATNVVEDDDAEESDLPASMRAPWRWERLLVDSRVVAGSERWTRRLNGLIQETELQRREVARTEPDSPRVGQLSRRIGDLTALSAFTLPIVRMLAAWPPQATWSEWLDAFEHLAPEALDKPARVLRVLADLRPMGAIGPISLKEASSVLAERLSTIEAEPPARRYGRVFVGSPAQLRGRAFDVVFVPALAERMFPQKPREDPLLLDDPRQLLSGDLPTLADRAENEKLNLRIAVGAATSRLYVSFPTLEVGEGRPRVPSLYALEVWRAMTGQVPSADELKQTAASASRATLAWPAPAQPSEAIDALEHDLSTVNVLARRQHDARGRAHYILQLNDALHRSVRERYMRARSAWSHWDGLTRVSDRTAAALARERLTARAYSLSALQRYSTCPYQFVLGAIHRLRPADDLEPLQRLDPLTRGSLFHAIQTSFHRRLNATGELPVTAESRERAFAVLDAAIEEVAGRYHELLAPAIEGVWRDEVAAVRRDLRMWVNEVAHTADGWVPRWFEWSFGLDPSGAGGEADVAHDPSSVRKTAPIDGRFHLRGSIDVIEERTMTGELRVTDYKTGRFRGKDCMEIGGGAVLQPVLYGLALEAATGQHVAQGRLYFATSDGGYRDVCIDLTPHARRAGVEALEIIDRAVETGFLPPAPAENACSWCDFRSVCGPSVERRVQRKSSEPLEDLMALRRKP